MIKLLPQAKPKLLSVLDVMLVKCRVVVILIRSRKFLVYYLLLRGVCFVGPVLGSGFLFDASSVMPSWPGGIKVITIMR